MNTLDPGWLRTDTGGPEAGHDVTTALPGALEPALLEDYGPSGQCYAAQDFRSIKRGGGGIRLVKPNSVAI